MTENAPSLYPLVLRPILKEKVWGGRRLEQFGKALPQSVNIGESWELADLDATSASGGGGDSAHSIINNGQLEGSTIRDAITHWGADLIDPNKLTPSGGFPLLVKYLDAREHLSVQVHPSPAYAASHDEAHLKTESWLILDAEPGAVIYKGLQQGITKHDLRNAIETQTVPDVIAQCPAVVGACHTLPSGTVHALGAGILVAEVQTPSDTTFRVYDWAKEYSRQGRELHVEQAVECATDEAPSDAIAADLSISNAPMGAAGPPTMGNTRSRVSETDFYTMDVISASCSEVKIAERAQGPVVLMVPKTTGASIASTSGSFDEVVLEAGQTVLIPAAIAQDTVLRAGPGTLAVAVNISG